MQKGPPKLNRTHLLYFFGIMGIILSMLLPSLGWLPLLAFLLVLPMGAIRIWSDGSVVIAVDLFANLFAQPKGSQASCAASLKINGKSDLS